MSLEKLTKGELTAARILEATAHCIEETSITRIAEEAGVSRGLVAHYFPEKSRIFLQVIRYIVDKGYRQIDSQSNSERPLERLLHVFRMNLEFFLTRPDYLNCFVLFYYFSTLDAEFRELNTMLSQRAAERIHRALLACKVRDRGFADSLHSLLAGAIIKFHTTRHGLSPMEYTGRFLKEIKSQVSSRKFL